MDYCWLLVFCSLRYVLQEELNRPQFGQSILINRYWWEALVIGYKVMELIFSHLIQFRSALIMLLYKKVLRINTRVRQEMGVGKIVNLMSNDIEKIIQVVWQFHFGWTAILQIISK